MMLGQLFTIAVHLHGTLAADAAGRFKLPCGATLKEVQASGSNANDAELTFGTAADPDGYLAGGSIGDSEAVVTFDNDDWDGDLYTDEDDIENVHLAEDTVIEWSLDHDGDGGDAAANVDLLFVWIEG